MLQPNTSIIKAENLSWQVREKSILNDLSFSISAGEFVGIIGPNGAGKSSLLRCIYGQVEPSKGQIFVDNQQVKDYPRRKLAQKVAVVLQEPATQFEHSVFEVISMGLTPRKSLLSFDTEEDRIAICEAAEKVDLSDKICQSFNSLSGGEKQRVLIARAILQSPQILLMDEPTNHLDIRHQIEVLELAREMNISVVVSIHDLNLAATFCDRLIMLDEGKIVAEGDIESVLTEEKIKQVFSVNSKVDKHPFNDKLRITFDHNKPHLDAINNGVRK